MSRIRVGPFVGDDAPGDTDSAADRPNADSLQPHRSSPSDLGRDVQALSAQVTALRAERLSLQEQVRRLQRVKAMADLLTGAAHDLSSAMTGIVWCSEALRKRLEGRDHDLEAGLNDFVEAAAYARKLARRITSLAQQEAATLQVFRLRDVVQDALSLIETLRPSQVQLDLALGDEDTYVRGIPDQLQQVVINLVSNAFDAAAPSGSRVRIELSVDPLEADGPQPWLRLRVEDEGHGMTADVLERAFEPFFTTKGSEHEGNGLGLVVVRTIVEGHAGYIEVKSEPGRGTTVDVFLPQHVARAEPL